MSDSVEVRITQRQGWESLEEAQRLLDNVNSEAPDPKLVRKLRKILSSSPDLWLDLGGDVARHVRDKLVERLHGAKVSELAMKQGAVFTRDALGYDRGSQLERLLIDHLVLAWLRWQDVEWRYQSVVCSDESRPIYQVDWWERRLNAAQRRFLRASETLVRVQKLLRGMRPTQVNIAKEGGQQVNIAGDVKLEQANQG